jgi:hypothetical protein
MLNLLHMIRLDYLSCIFIGIRTAQFGFVPANLLCIALYTSNLVNWRPKKQSE